LYSVKTARVLIPIPAYGFDPSETSIPWKTLSAKGYRVVFATPKGDAAAADEIMLTGKSLGVLKGLLAARSDAVLAYREMEQDAEYRNPVSYADLGAEDFTGLFLPGGHDKGVREYLESETLQNLVVAFITSGKAVGAICHGVLLAARSKDPVSGGSVLRGFKVTSLLKFQELAAWRLTRLWLGDYYLTYPGTTVEDEVRSLLAPDGSFLRGPLPLWRDSPERLQRGFSVRHGRLITARWPGDVYNVSLGFASMLDEA